MRKATPPDAAILPLLAYGDEEARARIYSWFVVVTLAALLGSIGVVMTNGDTLLAIIVAAAIPPVLAVSLLIRRRHLETAAVLLVLILLAMLTALATTSLGIHNISNMAIPVLLIIASMVTTRRTLAVLTLASLGCTAWLVFGELSGAYTPRALVRSVPGDFLSTAIAVILASVMARFLVEAWLRNSAALASSEARFRAVVEYGYDGILFTDETGRILYRSPSYGRINGYSNDERVGHVGFETVHPDDVDALQKDYADLVRTPGALSQNEYRIRHKDGSWRWLQSSALNCLEKPEVRAVVITSKDVTAQKQAQESLEENERRYRGLFENAPVGIFHAEPGGMLLRLNPALAVMLGYEGGGDLASLAADIDTRQSNDLWRAPELFAHAMGPGTWVRMERQSVRRDGQPITLDLSVRAVSSPEGTGVYLEGFVQDITKRRDAELAMRRSEEKFRALFEQAEDSIFILEPRHAGIPVIVEANQASCRKHGYEHAELVGKAIDSLDPGLEKQAVAARQERMQSGESVLFESVHQRKDGSTFPVEVSAKLVQRSGMSPVIFAIERDVTERKQAEEARGKLQAQLLQSQKMESVGRLAGGIAHDFNNLLSVILGNAEIALEEDVSPSVRTDLQEIRKAAGHSAELTRKLLAFARRQDIVPRVVDLNDVVAGMLKMLQRLIGEDIRLVWEPWPELWTVKVDPTQVEQILANLSVNARDAIDGVGRLTVSTENAVVDEAACRERPGWLPGEYVLLKVADTGTGMTEETLRNIFEPFFTTKSIGKGTGLGLATVYGIVKQNNGFVGVTSEEGKGSTFWIYVPRTRDSLDPGADVIHEGPTAGRETLLVVEDEEGILRLVKTALERVGYTVLTASTPGAALSLAENHPGPLHLLLTDIVMPEMSGRELRDRIVGLRPGIKVLFMSGHTADVIARRGVIDQGMHFLKKPFSMQALSSKVHELLGSG